MPDPKETNQKTPETRPDAETPKKPTQAGNEQGTSDTQPNVAPKPQVQKEKEPEKKSA